MNIYQVPWRLVLNKIVRYPGGRELDRFRGIYPGADDNRPEAWIGSDTRTVNALQKGDPNDGCSECILPDGSRRYLFEVVQDCPEQALGQDHRAIHGDRIGLLVKLLDAQYQLGLQTHPTRAYAKKYFASDYGKEESWYVIGLRGDSSEPPYVLLGFKEGVTRRQFEDAFDAGDIDAMEACCHKIQARVGDAFYIKAGAPHAIGCGCLVVEVQEPSDITVGARKMASGTAEDQERHKQRLLGCYSYDGCNESENRRRYLIEPQVIRSGDWGQETIVISQGTAEHFSFTRLDARQDVALLRTGALQVMIVLQGQGVMHCGDYDLSLKQGDELFIPFAAEGVHVSPVNPEETLSLVLCNPEQAQEKTHGSP